MEVDAEKAKEASPHLHYEMEMLLDLWEIIQAFKPTEDPNSITSIRATIEAFGIHARALYQFFFYKGKDDDVVARHYVCDWECLRKKEKLEPTQRHQKAIKRISKEFAHLTYTRLERKTEEQKEWNKDAPLLLKLLTNAIETLMKKTPEERLDEKKDWEGLRDRIKPASTFIQSLFQDLPYATNTASPSLIRMEDQATGAVTYFNPSDRTGNP